MKVTVLKDFPYAHDGLRVEMMKAGETKEVREELVGGLAAAGWIGLPEEQKALPGMGVSAPKAGAPENRMLPGPSQNKADATDTTPQRDRRSAHGKGNQK